MSLKQGRKGCVGRFGGMKGRNEAIILESQKIEERLFFKGCDVYTGMPAATSLVV